MNELAKAIYDLITYLKNKPDFKYRTRVVSAVYTQNITLDLTDQGYLDISFKNTGTQDVHLIFNSGNKFKLLVTDAMLTVAGYDNCLKEDIIEIQFVGPGVGELEVEGQKITKINC